MQCHERHNSSTTSKQFQLTKPLTTLPLENNHQLFASICAFFLFHILFLFLLKLYELEHSQKSFSTRLLISIQTKSFISLKTHFLHFLALSLSLAQLSASFEMSRVYLLIHFCPRKPHFGSATGGPLPIH